MVMRYRELCEMGRRIMDNEIQRVGQGNVCISITVGSLYDVP